MNIKIYPQASVAVVTKTLKCPSKNIFSIKDLSFLSNPALCIPTPLKQTSLRGPCFNFSIILKAESGDLKRLSSSFSLAIFNRIYAVFKVSFLEWTKIMTYLPLVISFLVKL